MLFEQTRDIEMDQPIMRQPMNTRTKNQWLFGAVALGLVAVLALALALLRPVSPMNETAIQSANALVAAGRPAEAIAIYDQLLDDGLRSSAMYYNRGIAQYQLGEYAAAAASFREAAALSPRDPDIAANLALALEQAPEAAVAVPADPMGLLARLTSGWLSLDEVALAAVALWFAACIAFLARSVLAQSGRWTGRLAFALGLLTLVLGLSLAGRLLSGGPAPAEAPPAALAVETGP